MRRLAVVWLVAALCAGSAIAATDPTPDSDKLEAPTFTAEPAFRDLDLLGTWAVDCDKPASPVNPHVATTAPGGGVVVETHDVGPEFDANRYHFVAARRLGQDRVEAQALFQPGTEGEEAQTLVMRVGKDRQGTETRRTMFNRGEDGEVRVKNGVAVRSGARTAVLKRCW